jgi:MFS family permease
VLLFGQAGGLLADRAGKRRVLSVTQASAGLPAAAFAVLTSTHEMRLAPTMPLELAALVFVGYGSITFNSMAKTVLQLAAKPTMRGRVMALWGLAWLGSTPIGGSIVGWIGQDAGARWSLVVGGLPTVLCGLLALPALTRIDRRRAAAGTEAGTEAGIS